MNSVVSLLGPRVRQLRLERGLTLEQLSEATGLGLEMLKKIERGDRWTPSFGPKLGSAKEVLCSGFVRSCSVCI
jgi:cytoskeletal protein RodZ